MLEYYLPGLDASALSETEFTQKMAHLLRLRELEHANQVQNTLNNLF